MDLSHIPSLANEVVKKGEGLLSTLFGPAVAEIGASLSDKVKYRRFKNQLTIFAKANDFLQSKGLHAKPLALKYLVPLIDLSSLEEEPKLQERWASIIANLAAYDSLDLFNKNCIGLLNKLSYEEVFLIDTLYGDFIKQRGEVITQQNGKIALIDYREVHAEDVLFDPWEIGKTHGIEELRIKLYVENMVALGLLQFEEIFLEDDELVKSFNVHLSYLGLYFVRICKFL